MKTLNRRARQIQAGLRVAQADSNIVIVQDPKTPYGVRFVASKSLKQVLCDALS